MDNQDALSQFKEKFSSFYQTNKKSIAIVSAVVIAGVAGGYYWANEYIPAQESKAAKALAPMHYYFKNDSMEISIAYMRTKKYEEALDYLDKTEANDKILAGSILNMKAVCYSNLGETEKAASYFAKAGDIAENEFSAEYYKRAGIHYETAENYEKALKYYQIIADKYPTSGVGTDINKYVYKMKAKLGDYNP